MKKLLILLLLPFSSLKAQEEINYKSYGIDTSRNELGKLRLIKIFEYKDSTLKKEVLYDKAKEFILKSFINGSKITIYDDKLNGKMLGDAITSKIKYNNNCFAGHFEYKLTIYLKDKKAKVIFDNIIFKKDECPMEAKDGSDFGDIFPSTWGTIAKKYDTKKYREIKAEAFNEFLLILKQFENFTRNTKKDGDF